MDTGPQPHPPDRSGNISQKTRAGGRVRRIVIDRDKCLGAGSCVAAAPGVFALDGENLAYVADAAAADEDTILLAAQSCPVLAITLYAEDGREIFPGN